jgi:hypothetical protein|tara:strand:- start:378 stop:614 length:237 start_codon:yes stop_codon:yes gene_type:complete
MEITYISWEDDYVFCVRKEGRYVNAKDWPDNPDLSRTRGGRINAKLNMYFCGCDWCIQDIVRQDFYSKINIVVLEQRI